KASEPTLDLPLVPGLPDRAVDDVDVEGEAGFLEAAAVKLRPVVDDNRLRLAETRPITPDARVAPEKFLLRADGVPQAQHHRVRTRRQEADVHADNHPGEPVESDGNPGAPQRDVALGIQDDDV